MSILSLYLGGGEGEETTAERQRGWGEERCSKHGLNYSACSSKSLEPGVSKKEKNEKGTGQVRTGDLAWVPPTPSLFASPVATQVILGQSEWVSHSAKQITVKAESKSGWVPVTGKTYLPHIL